MDDARLQTDHTTSECAHTTDRSASPHVPPRSPTTCVTGINKTNWLFRNNGKVNHLQTKGNRKCCPFSVNTTSRSEVSCLASNYLMTNALDYHQQLDLSNTLLSLTLTKQGSTCGSLYILDLHNMRHSSVSITTAENLDHSLPDTATSPLLSTIPHDPQTLSPSPTNIPLLIMSPTPPPPPPTTTMEALSLHEQVVENSYDYQSAYNSCDGYLCTDLFYNLSHFFGNTTWLPNNTLDSTLFVEEPNWHVLLLLFVVLAGIMGNLLVCLAIVTQKKLQNITNYFLMSLAVADLLVSLVVMPLSIINEFVGYWPFDLVTCNLWQVSDVMLCTSSIMHMCTISLDRYIGIRHPLKNRNKSMSQVIVKVTVVWLISLFTASPIIMLTLLDPNNVLQPDENGNPQCAIFNHHFLIYGSLSAFFIPLVIMVIAYALTIHLLNQQAKLCSRSGSGKPTIRRTCSRKQKSRRSSSSPSILGQSENFPQTSSNGVNLARKLHYRRERCRASSGETEPLKRNDRLSTDSEGGLPCNNNTTPSPTPVQKTLSAGAPRLQTLVRKHSVAIRAASLLLQRRVTEDPNKPSTSTVHTERKAVKVLGTVFAIFVLCWAPFFTANITTGLCHACNIEVLLFKIFLWLGYISSTINPIIYTIFNKTFRHTFIQLLLCRYKTKRKIRNMSTYANGDSSHHTRLQCSTLLCDSAAFDELQETVV